LKVLVEVFWNEQITPMGNWAVSDEKPFGIDEISGTIVVCPVKESALSRRVHIGTTIDQQQYISNAGQDDQYPGIFGEYTVIRQNSPLFSHGKLPRCLDE
jgi:hypothetical protein